MRPQPSIEAPCVSSLALQSASDSASDSHPVASLSSKGTHMRSIARFTTLLGVAASVSLAVQAAAQTASTERTLLRLEADWEQANAKNNTAALEQILAPEFVSTDSDGRLTTRAENLARRKAGAVKF